MLTNWVIIHSTGIPQGSEGIPGVHGSQDSALYSGQYGSNKGIEILENVSAGEDIPLKLARSP